MFFRYRMAAPEPPVDELAIVKEKMELLFEAIQSDSGKYRHGTVTKKEVTPAATKIDFCVPMNGKLVKICGVYVRDHNEYKRGDVVMASPHSRTVAFNLLMEDMLFMGFFVDKFDPVKGLCGKTDFRKGFECGMSKQLDIVQDTKAEMQKLVTALNNIGKIVEENAPVMAPPPSSPA